VSVKRGEAYRVLARKYRPSDFTGLIGQDALVKTLSNAFATGRIAHAFMLTAYAVSARRRTARIIARALNCIGPDGKRKEPTVTPCGVCEPCVAIAESRHVDVQEMDAASNNGVEEVRQIIDACAMPPPARATRSTSSTKCTCFEGRPSTLSSRRWKSRRRT